MVMVRPAHHGFDLPGGGAASGDGSGAASGGTSGGGGGRLNLLLSYAGWQEDSWADHLPRLLEPFGVAAWRADSAHEATTLIRRMPVHIAVVDLSMPLARTSEQQQDTIEAAGLRVLELLARLDQPPPTVVVNRRRTRREESRQLATALEAGVFAVLEPPVRVETALEVMRRVLRRHYADRWPTSTTTHPPHPPQPPDHDSDPPPGS